MKKTKKQLVSYLINELSDCGYNDWFGYKMKDKDFQKLMMKKQKWELENIINDLSKESAEFLTR